MVYEYANCVEVAQGRLHWQNCVIILFNPLVQ